MCPVGAGCVLRLLVKDVLVGPEKLTIRHRIPIRERTSHSNQEHQTPDAEGDQSASCPLRWGGDDTHSWIGPDRNSVIDRYSSVNIVASDLASDGHQANAGRHGSERTAWR
jgi:hypothetical protein